jgi:hypothetical protein
MPELFQIHVTSRSRHNRTERAALPANPRMKQHVGPQQGRVMRGQPLTVTAEKLAAMLPELRQKAKQHVLEVRTMDGRKVDLETMEVSKALPQVPPVNKPLDSLANDKNPVWPEGSRYVPPYVSDETVMPQLVKAGERPQLLASEDGAPEEPAADQSIPSPPLVPTGVDAALPTEAPPPGQDDESTGDTELDQAVEQAQKEAAGEGSDVEAT